MRTDLASRSRRKFSGVLFATLLAAAPASASVPAAWTPLPTLYDASAQSGRDIEAAPLDYAAFKSREAHAEENPSVTGGGKKAILYSLLLPGLGELSIGEKGRATGFFIVEGLIWTHFIYWTVAGNMRQDDYVEQAMLNAGIGVSNESDDYWRLVGQYERSNGSGAESYEEDLRRQARDTYPGDPAAQDAFVAEQLPVGDRAWEWSSPDLQASYRSTRESSNNAFNEAKYSFAAAILNRIVSVIDVQLLRHKAAKDRQASRYETGYRLYADTAADGSGRVRIQRRF